MYSLRKVALEESGPVIHGPDVSARLCKILNNTALTLCRISLRLKWNESGLSLALVVY